MAHGDRRVNDSKRTSTLSRRLSATISEFHSETANSQGSGKELELTSAIWRQRPPEQDDKKILSACYLELVGILTHPSAVADPPPR